MLFRDDDPPHHVSGETKNDAPRHDAEDCPYQTNERGVDPEIDSEPTAHACNLAVGDRPGQPSIRRVLGNRPRPVRHDDPCGDVSDDSTNDPSRKNRENDPGKSYKRDVGIQVLGNSGADAAESAPGRTPRQTPRSRSSRSNLCAAVAAKRRVNVELAGTLSASHQNLQVFVSLNTALVADCSAGRRKRGTGPAGDQAPVE